MTPKPLIVLDKVSKHYVQGEAGNVVTVLNALSLTIAAGELLAVVGTSGSGKSTLMNILGLLDTAITGKYWLNGQDVSDLTDDARAVFRNQQFGFVFQQFHLLPRFSVRHNVALPLMYRGWTAERIEPRVLEVLDKVGMARYVDYLPLQLSGGQQQRIAIARALVGNPAIILADEPTGALDSETGKDIMRVLLGLQGEGRTLLLVTHDESIARLCPRRIVMADGRMINEVTLCN
jgi:putative ABC transport system ATP-binding protein